MDNIINKDELENTIQKVSIFNNEQELLVSDFKTIFKNFHYAYNTNNTEKMDILESDLLKGFNVIATNSNQCVLILNRVLTKYVETEHYVSSMFKNIKE